MSTLLLLFILLLLHVSIALLTVALPHLSPRVRYLLEEPLCLLARRVRPVAN